MNFISISFKNAGSAKARDHRKVIGRSSINKVNIISSSI